MERYPKLFGLDAGGQMMCSGYPDVDDGWRELLERAMERIAAAIRHQPSARVRITRTKEKFGGIRIYYDEYGLSRETAAAVEEAIELAGARSTCTCETCGRVGQLFYTDGWIAARCDEHAADGAKALGPQLRVEKYGYVDGKWTIVSRRRYDRESDAFVDEAESSDEIAANDPQSP
ncbi:hypothetical protein MXD81_50340 [Microbacteriaceae bacterium K1510]|nr:hypothetical protein [Microbacteriaceae bacterium K1510]